MLPQNSDDAVSLYRGRFAPSPTGPLHFGSLVAATASYLDARSHGGEWLVRIEDVDTGRAVPGAAENILATLETFGFQWDGPVLWQSRRTERYQEALDALRAEDLVFACRCSRKDLGAIGRYSEDGVAWYPGTCRRASWHQRLGIPVDWSWRFRVNETPVIFVDRWRGGVACDLAASVGDFVVFRRDGLFAYQLAVVVDDEDQQVTDIVRGEDLLWSTPRQIAIQRALGYSTPRYLHIPVVTSTDGRKLSKQNGAEALDVCRSSTTLLRAFRFLGLDAPQELESLPLNAIWQWGSTAWPKLAMAKSKDTVAGIEGAGNTDLRDH